MSNCSIIAVSEKQLVLQIPQSIRAVVDIPQVKQAVQFAACPSPLTVIEQAQQTAVIKKSAGHFVEIPKTSLVLQFPECIEINEAAPQQPIEEAIAIVNVYEVGVTPVQTNRAVLLDGDGRIVHADKDISPLDERRIVGVSRQSGATGQLVEVVEFGKLTGTGFGAAGDKFYLGNNGLLTDTPAATGWWVFIGTQLNGGQFFVNKDDPIRRS